MSKKVEPIFHELVSRVRAGKRLVLLAGAGVSIPVVRSGEQLTRDFNEQLRKKRRISPRNWRMLRYSEAFQRTIPRPEDRRAFIEAE
jgi:hypothetical protein